MVGVEIDMIVSDSLKALELYVKKNLILNELKLTNFPKCENEVVFSLYGVRFHMLDETSQVWIKST